MSEFINIKIRNIIPIPNPLNNITYSLDDGLMNKLSGELDDELMSDKILNTRLYYFLNPKLKGELENQLKDELNI